MVSENRESPGKTQRWYQRMGRCDRCRELRDQDRYRVRQTGKATGQDGDREDQVPGAHNEGDTERQVVVTQRSTEMGREMERSQASAATHTAGKEASWWERCKGRDTGDLGSTRN